MSNKRASASIESIEHKSFYPVIEGDPISVATESVVHQLREGNFRKATSYYRGLVAVIELRGNHGKDIRYAQRELNEFAAEYRTIDRGISRAAENYARHMPKPADAGKRESPFGIERTVVEQRHHDSESEED